MSYYKPGCKPTQEEFIKRLKDLDENIICLDTYIDSKTPLRFIYKPTEVEFLRSPNSLFKRLGYPFSIKASNGEIIIGVNDLETTHPYIASLLFNKDDGKKYSFGTGYKLKFICPECNGLIETRPWNLLNEHNNIRCPYCSDGFSYPEKLVANVLKELGISYKYQLSSATFLWCGVYRYDFYIPDYNMIIEVNGLQHYEDKGWSQSLYEIQYNDKIKKELALKNKIDKYIVIDAKYSYCDYLKQSIINELSEYFNLSCIDWEKCFINAGKSRIILIADKWNQYHDIDIIINNFNLSRSTILRYLHKCRKLNYIDDSFDNFINQQKKKTELYMGIKKLNV